MEQYKIDRINHFARRIKAGETLSPEELIERDSLRQEYIAAVRRNLNAQLDNTYIQRPNGSKEKLRKKGES